MNTAIATRLLWKEYRQQRNLWIALLFGATLLQLIFWHFIETPRTEKDLINLMPLYVGTAAMMTGFFAVCSAAISFAIEREEGAHLRLVSLSCPPVLTLSIKFLVGIPGTTLLFAISAAIGVSLSTGFSLFADKVREASHNEWFCAAYWFVVVVCGGLASGMFFSLLFRKVLPAVIAACVTTFVAGPLLYGVWGTTLSIAGGGPSRIVRQEAVWFMAILLAGVGTIALIDFVLVRWWMNHGFSDTPRVRSRSIFRRVRVQRDGLDGSVTLEIGGADRAEFEVLTTDQARILPPPRLGLSLLYTNWGRGRARVLRFLCWKEMAESRRLFLIMLGIGVLLAMISGFEARALAYNEYQIRQYESPDWLPFAFTVSLVSMFVCGLMTFRGEQSQDNYRLLSDHGVTPGYVWASKQIVWFGRLLAIPLAMTAVYSVILGFGLEQFEPRAVFRHNQDWDNLSALWWLTDCVKIVATLLTFYSVTQMASLTWRRAALSIFFALLCCVLLGMWLGATTHFDVPVFAGILPLAPAMLLMTRLRTRGWLIGDDRFKRWLLPGTVGVLGIAACWLTTAAWRVFEIPTAQPIVATKTLDDGSTAETINGLTDAERAAILAPVSDSEKEAAGLYEKAAISGPQLVEVCLQTADLDSCAFESPGSDTLIKCSVTRLQMYALADNVLARAKREVEFGNTEEALSLIGSTLRIARHAAGRGANRDFDQWRTITLGAMQALVEWSASEGVTAELVTEANELVREHMERSPDLFAVSFAHHRIVRNTLDLAFEEMRALRHGGDSFDTKDYFEKYMMLKFPGTRWRIDRLVDWYEVRSAELIAEADRVGDQETSTGKSLGGWYREKREASLVFSHTPTRSEYNRRLQSLPEHKHWLRTTPIPGGILDDIGLSLVFVRTDAETKSRGTQIAMQLHQTRRESGELPKSLDDLKVAGDVLIDPWSGRQFVWYPEGISNEINTTDPPIPANTPFLFSGGPAGGHLEMLPEISRIEGSFDPTATVIPLDGKEDGAQAAGGGQEGDVSGAQSLTGNPPADQESVGPGFGPGEEDLVGAFSSGGMGASEPAVRWETISKWAVVGQSGDTNTIAIKPVVWLFPEVDTTSAE